MLWRGEEVEEVELWGGLLSLPRLGILWDPGETGVEKLHRGRKDTAWKTGFHEGENPGKGGSQQIECE